MLNSTEVLTQILSHLPPKSLADISLVSHHFHALVTLPHAWRMAFARFFPGAESLIRLSQTAIASNHANLVYSERRVFTRLTALASWRTEYMLRTLMIRSLNQGKPVEFTGRHEHGNPTFDATESKNGQITYNSKLNSVVTHLHGTFGTNVNKKPPRFIHGASGVGSSSMSDPRFARVEPWGTADPQRFSQFTDEFLGDAEYGLGAGNVVGVPNPMSVSQPYGMVYAEGFPGGSVYYRSPEEQRGRTLASSQGVANLELGIPNLQDLETTCAVWIAKTSNVPEISKGLVGILTGSSHGIVSSYSLGTNNLRERRIERGEITARWMLSPGVPIVAIAVDEDFSLKRQANHRIWAIALNALGEIFYLTEFPERASDPRVREGQSQLEQLAWETGRSVHWKFLEATRRAARPDPFNELSVDSSYFPRTSWAGMHLSKAQIVAETREIEVFANHKPKHFRQICNGWDMRRRLEVDFAAGDETGANECVIVIRCGLDEGQPVSVKRFTRYLLEDPSDNLFEAEVPLASNDLSGDDGNAPLHTSSTDPTDNQPGWSFQDINLPRRGSVLSFDSSGPKVVEEWRTSTLLFNGLKTAQISTTALDLSTFAKLTIFEDPLLSMAGSPDSSSASSSPAGRTPYSDLSLDVPGQRARLMAAGTKSGTIIIWNVRATGPDNKVLEGTINPVRIIRTDSPQISSLALSALYLVHGGNDGLVQAWDPLASSLEPIRTLNSRSSTRARQRFFEAETSRQTGRISSYAAAAISLDPDSTVLRGMVSLGMHVRYWSYTSSGAEKYQSMKRKIRRSARRNNQGIQRFSSTGRGALQEYIYTEKLELEQEKKKKRKEEERLAGRFGLNLLGPEAGEDEILAYATLLSQEAAVSDEDRRKSGGESAIRRETNTEEVGDAGLAAATRDELDADVAEAIRLSLQETEANLAVGANAAESSSLPYSIRYTTRRKSSLLSPTTSPSGGHRIGNTSSAAMDDLDFALRLSLEDESIAQESGTGAGKGKEKERRN